jgi:hypothetical protein
LSLVRIPISPLRQRTFDDKTLDRINQGYRRKALPKLVAPA